MNCYMYNPTTKWHILPHLWNTTWICYHLTICYLNIAHNNLLFRVLESLIFKWRICHSILMLKCPKYLRTVLSAKLVLGNSSAYFKVLWYVSFQNIKRKKLFFYILIIWWLCIWWYDNVEFYMFYILCQDNCYNDYVMLILVWYRMICYCYVSSVLE